MSRTGTFQDVLLNSENDADNEILSQPDVDTIFNDYDGGSRRWLLVEIRPAGNVQIRAKNTECCPKKLRIRSPDKKGRRRFGIGAYKKKFLFQLRLR
ncbi:hypothetical protein KM043_011346 [Ampulex compressa]|nr:hypothetical protein KM043_011346 [Ampulex compressa]